MVEGRPIRLRSGGTQDSSASWHRSSKGIDTFFQHPDRFEHAKLVLSHLNRNPGPAENLSDREGLPFHHGGKNLVEDLTPPVGRDGPILAYCFSE